MNTTADPLEGIMRKVAGLLANADDPATPPAAAETFRAKADYLMLKYKIDSLMAPSTAVARPVPVWRTVWVCRVGSPWASYYLGIAGQALDYNDTRKQRVVQRNEDDGYNWYVYEAVGYQSDLAYAELLVTNALIEFGRRLEPQYDKGETLAQNALRMRQGGMERKRIAERLYGGWVNENEMKAKNRKVTGLIKEEAARIGKPGLAEELLGRSVNIKTYRESYANSFYWTLNSRIRMRRLDEQAAEQALVLASAKDAVDEAFYEKYPHLRPAAQVESGVAAAKECAKCSKAKSGYCRDHSWMRPRYSSRTAPHSAAGSRAGAHAARNVDLGATPGGRKVPGTASRPALG